MVVITAQALRRYGLYLSLVSAGLVQTACGGAAGSEGARVQDEAQRIVFGEAPALEVTARAFVRATASSALPPVYSSLTPEVCQVEPDSGQVTGLSQGECTIAADQRGNDAYAPAAQATQRVVVAGRRQSLTVDLPKAVEVNETVRIQALASSGLRPRYTSLSPEFCSVEADSGEIKGMAVGTCRVLAHQEGDVLWAAAPQVSGELSVSPRAQVLELQRLEGQQVGGRVSVSARASSELPVSIRSLTPTVCSLSPGSSVAIALAVGTCTIELSQPGDFRWAPALTLTQSFTIGKGEQRISFAGVAPSLVAGGSALLHAQASSALPVSFSSLSPGVCSISAAGQVSALQSGQCLIAAQQAGNIHWLAAAQATLNFPIQGKGQSIAFAPVASLVAGESAGLKANASSGLAVTYSSLSSSVCRVDGVSGWVTGLIPGVCEIAADQRGNGEWGAAQQVKLSLQIAPKPNQQAKQTLQFASAPTLSLGATAVLGASASSGLAVVFSSLSPGICSVQSTSGVVSALATGSCVIAANQSGNSKWLPASQVTQELWVQGKAQSVVFSAAPSLYVGSTGFVRAAASSGLSVMYGSLTGAVCSVDANSGQVQGLTPGSCSVSATQSGNATWAAATAATQVLLVGPNPRQTLSFSPAPALTLGGSATVRATASSGLAVSYSSLSPGVCNVQAASGFVTSSALGDCVIAANQAGNGNINPAPQVQLTLPVNLPAGVSVPGIPQSVSATLGGNIGTVLVSIGAIESGGMPITQYSVTSSPPGIQVKATAAPITVTCPTSCAGYAFSVSANNAAGQGRISAAVPVLTTFDVTTTFYEPDTQPRNSIFVGSFTLNSTTGAISNLAGRLTESMTGNALGSAPFFDMTQVPLSYQLQSWRDTGLGGSFAASFAKNSTSTFSTMAGGDGWSPRAGVDVGGVYAGFPSAYASSVKNSSILIFVPDNPFAELTAAQLAKLAYADCAPGGMMGAVCMTGTNVSGYGSTGTMSGYPLSQRLVKR